MEAFRLALDIPQLIRVNRTRRLVMQVPLNYVLARRTLLRGFLLFCCYYFRPKILHLCPDLIFDTKHFMQNGKAHFKRVFGRRNTHRDSHRIRFPHFFLPNRTWHFGRIVELWVKHNMKYFKKTLCIRFSTCEVRRIKQQSNFRRIFDWPRQRCGRN